MNFYFIKKRVPPSIKKIVKPPLIRLRLYQSDSVQIFDQAIIDAFIANADNTFLVSFPRTGSHWLRMITELYFGRPSLVRVFYYPERQDYLMLHTHDIELDVYRKNVIYLYRDPVPTIYSQMRYYKEHIDDKERVSYWATLYGKHLVKWLLEETISEKKIILRYECMVKDIAAEFSKLTDHFGQSLYTRKLWRIARHISKSEVKKKTAHDPQVINCDHSYENQREEFFKKYSGNINEIVFSQNTQLEQYFRSV